MYDITGKKAVVVGGTGGIGAAVSDMLRMRGAEVTSTGKSKGDIALDLSMFFSDSVNSEYIAKKELLISKVYNCDILCLCFGPFVQKSLTDTSFDDWKNVALLDYALQGFLTSTALRGMTERKYGRIILFGGTRTDQIRAYKTNSAYAGAKTGLSVLAKSVAAEYSRYNITCNVILPGFVNTEYLSNDLQNTLRVKMPSGKLIEKKIIADTLSFLIDTREISGVLLGIDEGWSA